MNTTADEPESRIPYLSSRYSVIGQTDANTDHSEQASPDQAHHSRSSGHGAHKLAMLICCIPMIAVAVVLITTGVAGSGALLWALGCLMMMAMMMFMMRGEHTHK